MGLQWDAAAFRNERCLKTAGEMEEIKVGLAHPRRADRARHQPRERAARGAAFPSELRPCRESWLER
jgi:hypothetical protein